HGRAVEQDLPLVRRDDAVDHLDESRFAGAVLAEQGVGFTGPDAEMDIVVGAHAGERLADADKLQSQGSFSLHLDMPSLPSLHPPPALTHARTTPVPARLAGGRRRLHCAPALFWRP